MNKERGICSLSLFLTPSRAQARPQYKEQRAWYSVSFWPDQQAGVQEMWRVLKPGGVIALILQPRWARTEQEVKENGDELAELLQQVGFQHIRLEMKLMKPIASMCVLGSK